MLTSILIRLRSERGIALPAMMSLMLVLGILTAGVVVTVQADTPVSRRDQDRKLAYGAAEAGLQNYLFRLQHDLDLWTQCTNVSGPPFVNQVWNGSGSDPRVWRSLPGSDAQYTVELLPANGYSQCSTASPAASVVQGGLIRIRATGRARGVKRSIIGKFRRRSFLDYLYFTDIESLDPAWYSRYVYGQPTIPDITQWASDNCGWYRNGRSSRRYNGNRYDQWNNPHAVSNLRCGEIQFANADVLNGPVHTNDEFLICGRPTFGRTADDQIEVSASAPGWRSACGGSSPTFRGTYNASAPLLTMPPTNTQLRDTTDPSYIFTGRTTIVLGASNMTVNGTVMSYPGNGQIYVQNGVCGQTLKTYDPYNSPLGCADVVVKGNYGASLTIASEKDIIINGNVTNSGDYLMALIADQFIRIYHPIQNLDVDDDDCDNSASGPFGGYLQNPTIVASLFALNHSFMVDNYFCGNPMGTLTVTGSIVQKYRGPVGTGGSSTSTGYIKAYAYDDRFRLREPPAVVDPIQSSWKVLAQTEQVPAR